MFEHWKRVPIPPVFFSEETEAPFRRCLACERDLVGSDVPYLIEKAFRVNRQYGARDLIFEYALCLPCYQTLEDSFSDESKQRMEAYAAERIDPNARARTLLSRPDADVQEWLAACLLTGTPADDLDEYQLLAVCHGDDLVLSHLPCLFSGAAMDEIVGLLSNQTLDELRGFMRDHLPQPPGLEVVPDAPLLFL